jgi:hypothetical protein
VISISDNNALIGVDIAGYLTADMPLRALNLRSGHDDQIRLPASASRTMAERATGGKSGCSRCQASSSQMM